MEGGERPGSINPEDRAAIARTSGIGVVGRAIEAAVGSLDDAGVRIRAGTSAGEAVNRGERTDSIHFEDRAKAGRTPVERRAVEIAVRPLNHPSEWIGTVGVGEGMQGRQRTCSVDLEDRPTAERS